MAHSFRKGVNTLQPQPAVTVGAGMIGMQAYQAVTTQGGKYVQGGGCTTVGLAGLVQGGGFGSFSKHYGTAAGSLLEAEVVTADGQIRIANACTNPDLFWALKGGEGGTFGVLSKMTLRLHDLPEFFGAAVFKIKASTDDAYHRLIREFVSFYREHLFNDHWGEQVHLYPDNTLEVKMVSHGVDTGAAKGIWQPFLHWVKSSPNGCSIEGSITIGSIPARHMWDVAWLKQHWPEIALPRNGNPFVALFDDVLDAVIPEPLFTADNRPGAGPNNVWWKGDGAGWFISAYQSLWLPESLLRDDMQANLANALFSASRFADFALHFNKGLAGSPGSHRSGKKHCNESVGVRGVCSCHHRRRRGPRVSWHSQSRA